ncbi:zinc finger protein 888-like [Copidosoma floridanum]|uniref:zinc finger protein 888-like n=1 Tax=Copidosoma floridanum TaxID=29053 RepID=UPI0006C948C6|nr:zinc finger protein 888-like [Copidosoma floridanum]
MSYGKRADKKRYQCKICRKFFTHKSTLKVHAVMHTDKRSFECHDCGNTFAYKHVLKNHICSIHIGEKSYQCTQCNKAFTRKDVLNRHTGVHTVEPPITYKCEISNKSFDQKEHLDEHNLHPSVDEPTQKYTQNEDVTLKPPYECKDCDKSLAQKDHLDVHAPGHEQTTEITISKDNSHDDTGENCHSEPKNNSDSSANAPTIYWRPWL